MGEHVSDGLFLSFGAIAVAVIAAGMGGFRQAIEGMLATPSQAPLLTRERVSPLYFFSYTFIPLSSIAFPHIGIFCLTAQATLAFPPDRRALSDLHAGDLAAVGLPRRGRQSRANVPAITAKLERARRWRRRRVAAAGRRAISCAQQANGDDVILRLVEGYAPVWLASLLGAAVMAAVMASDSQILALSTMFTEDVFAFYGGAVRFGQAVQVQTGRLFVIALTVLAYVIALGAPQSIFDLASQYAFAGYSALAPLLIAALFWKGSTKWGALATTLWTAAAVSGVALLQWVVPAPPPGVGSASCPSPGPTS